MPQPPINAIVVVSFGGPEGREDVLPFLDNVLRGRNVPRQRMLAVAEHYYACGGRSPIGPATRALALALEAELAAHGPALPVYQGNRNWHPFLADTVRQMAADGVQRALAVVTSAFGSYSGCRQYLEDIERARNEAGPGAPAIEKLRLFGAHPGFVALMADRLRAARARLPPAVASQAPVLFTAHSIPLAMAATAPYEAQLRESAAAIAAATPSPAWQLVYQSRSGPPAQPWLEPDVGDALRALHARGGRAVILVPLGFLSDHMEVVYDLDTEARSIADELGLAFARAETAGSHPGFASFLRGLIVEHLAGRAPAPCAPACCRYASTVNPGK